MDDRNADGTFAPGSVHNGGAGGRPPKKYSITSMLRAIGEELTEDGKETRAQRMARLIWTDAEGGNKLARKEIMDRLEGKPKERVEVEHSGWIDAEMTPEERKARIQELAERLAVNG